MAKKIIRLTESDLTRIVKRVIRTEKLNESIWSNIFGKPSSEEAAHSALKSQGYSQRGKSEERPDEIYTVFNGQKFYQDDIEYADYNDTGDIPRVENGKLIIANPVWGM